MKIAEKRCAEKYFEFTLVCKNADITMKRKMFMQLANVYLLGHDEAESLFANCEHDEVIRISDIEKFKRQKRLNQFFVETEKKARMSSPINELLDIKGNAIYALHEAEVSEDGQNGSNDANMTQKLMKAADLGIVDAMFLAAIMSVEGIAVSQNAYEGQRYLKRLSRWIDVDGLMLCLRYDNQKTAELMSKLYTITRGLSEAELYSAAKERFGIGKDIENKNILYLKKAVAADNKAKPSTYTSSLAHVAFSEILTDVDKQKILFAHDGEFFNAAASMPLDLPKRASVPSLGAIETSLGREGEQLKVRKILTSEAVIGMNKICFSCGDIYVLRAYMQAIKAADSVDNVRIIKLAETNEKGLSPSAMNVFLRAIDENKMNLFLVELDKTCLPTNIDCLQDIIDDEKRAHFSLAQLNMELDLSAVTFVLFCHDSVKNRLNDHVFDIPLSNISNTERIELIEQMVTSEAAKWGVSFDTTAIDALEQMEFDKAHYIIHYAAQKSFFEGEQVVTENTIKECYLKAVGSNPAFGFRERSK